MSLLRPALLGVLLLAFVLPVEAQEPPPSPALAAPPSPALAAPASPALQVKSTHGDWEVLCGKIAAAGIEECFMAQGVSARQTNQAIMTAMVLRPKGEPPVLRLTAPLGILLVRGLGFAIDGAEIGEVPFLYCLADGCVTQVTLEDDVLAKLKAGQKATATVYRPDNQAVGVPISLSGFTAAYAAL